jgi:hypothetical protein
MNFWNPQTRQDKTRQGKYTLVGGVTLEPELPDTRAPCDVRALPWAEAHGFLFSHGHGLGLTSTNEIHSTYDDDWGFLAQF